MTQNIATWTNMIPTLVSLILSLGDSLPAAIAVKATIALALGLIAAWLARKSRAAVRHAMLAAVFGVLLLLPLTAAFAPPIRIVFRTKREIVIPTAAATVVATPIPAAPAKPLPRNSPPFDFFLAAYLAGAGLFLLPVVTGLWQVRGLRRSALPWAIGQQVANRLSAHRDVEVLLHERVPGPMTSGILHPVIVLPSDVEAWSAEDLERAIVHELEHVRRADWVTRCLARIACAIYWFHPLVWIAWRKLVLDAERSCDDAVLGRSDAASYADQLVGLAKRLSAAQRPALLAMANRADLAARVGAVLDCNQKRGRLGKVTVAVASATAALALALSPLKIVAAPAPQAAGPVAAAVQAVTVPAATAPLAAFAPPQVVAAPTATIPHYTSSTTMVVVTVTVSEQNGNGVAGLNPTDFAIMEDGRRQVLALFEPQPEVSAYVLGYYAMPGDGSFRNTRVEVDRPALSVRVREGYYTDKPAAIANELSPDAPVPVYRPEAQYSEQARKAKWQGTVTMDVLIDASGHVASVNVSRPLGLGLDEKAVEAVKQWTFVPGKKNGQPVAVQAQVDVHFRLL